MQYPNTFGLACDYCQRHSLAKKDSRSNTKCARLNSQRQLPRKQRQEEKKRHDVYVPEEKEKKGKKKNVPKLIIKRQNCLIWCKVLIVLYLYTTSTRKITQPHQGSYVTLLCANILSLITTEVARLQNKNTKNPQQVQPVY